MTPDRFRDCLGALGWSQKAFAEYADIKDTTVRNHWATGRKPIPAPIAQWLETLVAAHERYPRHPSWAGRNPGIPPLPLMRAPPDDPPADAA